MSEEKISTAIIGFHGCDAANVTSIKADNFWISTGDHHWLGEGVYFFGEGFSDPIEDAKRWAIAESWDNEHKTRWYDKISVLKAEIRAQKSLNMTDDHGRQIVNHARNELSKRMRPNAGYIDSQIVSFLAKEHNFDVMIQDFYFQMTRERRLNIRSRYPNVRVICVRNPDSAIDRKTIVVTYTGLIPTNPQ